MKTILVPRRRFLRGAAGFTLALPLLPSLSARRALGDPVVVGPRRLFAIRTDHGAVRPELLFPSDATLTERAEVHPGHQVARGLLTRTVDGEMAAISPWLRARSSALSQRLVAKTNVLAGLDIPWYCGHNQGAMLGNFARSNTPNPLPQVPTLDQVLAWSPRFYRDATPKQRVVVFGHPHSPSFTWTQPSTRSGGVVHAPPSAYSARDMFRRLFEPTAESSGAGAAVAPRRPVVDRVIEDWRRARSDARLSAVDRGRLDAYIDGLAELDRKLRVAPAPPTCGTPKAPADPTAVGKRAGLDAMVEVIALAFMCGASRIAVGHMPNTFPFDDHPNWHNVAHSSFGNPSEEAKMLEHHRWTFENVLLRLAARLDVEEASGRTYLDNALLFMTMECGPYTHDDQSMPIVSLGSAGGTLRTGGYCDYRNRSAAALRRVEPGASLNTGLTYNQWLATAAQALGLDRAEFERDGQAGFGPIRVDNGYKGKLVPGVVERAGDWLPFLRA